MELPKGRWVVTAGFQFTSSFTNTTIANLKIGTSSVVGTTVRGTGNAGGGFNIVWTVDLGTTSTVYLTAYQGSSTDQTAGSVAMRAIRIA